MAEPAGGEGWLRGHPDRADALLSALVLVAALAPFAVGRESRMLALDPSGFQIGAAAVASLSLVLRRRHPGAVWLTATGVGLVSVLVGGGPTSAYIPALVALFTLSACAPTGLAIGAALVSAFAPVVLILGFGGDGAFDSVAFGMTAWSGIALMSGIAVRCQRAVVDSARERARLAETTREEEAQRRVTEERFRIARELHDVVAHHVSVINVQAGVAHHLVRTDPDRAAVALSHVREASQTVLHEVSAMLGLLRSDGDELETVPVPRLADVDALVDRVRRSGAQVVWQSTGALQELPPSVDLTAYRIVQEALTNAARHGVGPVRLELAYADEALGIEVRNERADPTSKPPTGRHGLAGMRERVSAVGGTLSAGATTDQGWVVSARLPLEPGATVVAGRSAPLPVASP